ncbi:hypothetical protein GGS20DRAFT_552776 [Poronia punctata]|nr:hypothetical protein GGS20DRAFT_552776 [Poronia punctata]
MLRIHLCVTAQILSLPHSVANVIDIGVAGIRLVLMRSFLTPLSSTRFLFLRIVHPSLSFGRPGPFITVFITATPFLFVVSIRARLFLFSTTLTSLFTGKSRLITVLLGMVFDCSSPLLDDFRTFALRISISSTGFVVLVTVCPWRGPQYRTNGSV